MDKKRLKQVIHDVRKFFKQLKLKVDKHIPISLVDEEEMTNNAFNIKSNTPVEPAEENIVCGLTILSCLWNKDQSKNPDHNFHFMGYVLFFFFFNNGIKD
ncbi:hypothetical protein WN943_019753 [Citrus x changshan-huyou]